MYFVVQPEGGSTRTRHWTCYSPGTEDYQYFIESVRAFVCERERCVYMRFLEGCVRVCVRLIMYLLSYFLRSISDTVIILQCQLLS